MGGEICFWQTLAKEMDVLVKVLQMLDTATLINVELTCKQGRTYMKQCNIWRKKFEVFSSPIWAQREILLAVETPYVGYKRLCLKAANLSLNMDKGYCKIYKTKLPDTFGRLSSGLLKHSIIAMHPDRVFIEGILRHPDQTIVVDVKSGKNMAVISPPYIDSFTKIVAADVLNNQLCLLREMLHFFVVEIYEPENAILTLRKQSDLTSVQIHGSGVAVKCVGDRIAVLSQHIDRTGEATMYVNFFWVFLKHADKRQKLTIERLSLFQKVVCAPEGCFVACVFALNTKHFVCTNSLQTTVAVWDLKQYAVCETETKSALFTWKEKIYLTPGVKISALDLQYPLLLLGKTNGMLELWDIQENNAMFTLCHGEIALSKVALLGDFIFGLNSNTCLCSWNIKTAVMAPGSKTKSLSIDGVISFVPDVTEILTLEGRAGQQNAFLVKRDFLNHVEPPHSIHVSSSEEVIVCESLNEEVEIISQDSGDVIVLN